MTASEKRYAAVFLDRDGTINEEVGYLDCLEKLRLLPGAAEAIRLINESGMKAVVVTNQSGVARGIFDEAFVDEVHARLRKMLGDQGAFLDGVYFCPHHPTEGRGRYLRSCDCRKPAPGLLLRAAEELSLDPERSTMIGDTLKDIEAAARIGMRGILVRTGYGAETADALGLAVEPRRTSPASGGGPPRGGPRHPSGPYRRRSSRRGTMAPEGPKNVNILIVKLSAIGDVIHTLPALAALRRLYPAADITWVVEEAAADLLADHPDLDRVLISRRKTWLKEFRQGRVAAPLREMHAFYRALRCRHYDLVIDFHGLLKSAVIVAMSGGRRRLGYDSLQELSGLFYNEKIAEEMGKHAVDRYLDFIRHLTGEGQEQADCLAAAPSFTIAIGEEERRRVEALLDEHAALLTAGAGLQDKRIESGGEEGPERRFVAVSPIAFWETKLWEDGKFAELCDRVWLEIGLPVILTGGAAAPLDNILGRMKTRAVNLGGQTTLRELACLYRQAALVITTDSGPMHLAAAVGTPLVALFGPTDPLRTGPYGPGHRVIRRELACMPCFQKRCETKQCMREIDVEDVLTAAKEILAGIGRSE